MEAVVAYEDTEGPVQAGELARARGAELAVARPTPTGG